MIQMMENKTIKYDGDMATLITDMGLIISSLYKRLLESGHKDAQAYKKYMLDEFPGAVRGSFDLIEAEVLLNKVKEKHSGSDKP